jgi:hypothetical protein
LCPQAGNAAVTVANLLGQVFERSTGAAHHIGEFQRLLMASMAGVKHSSLRRAAPLSALRSQILKNGCGFSQPASQGRLRFADFLVKVRGQLDHGLFLSGGLALTARPDQFCYADACVPGLLA